jgi:hypothetical protein
MKAIYAIPGIAATDKLLENIKVNGCEMIVLKWPATYEGIKLEDYARMFIEQIDQTKPFYLLGVSFGGMLCSELSHMMNTERVFLISTCKNRKELPWMLKIQKYIPLYNLFSENFLATNASMSYRLLGFKPDYKKILVEMMSEMQPNYLKRSIKMIVNWENTKMPKNYIHIHGSNDHLLFYSCVKADYTIQNGSHAMIVYNAEEINELLGTLI